MSDCGGCGSDQVEKLERKTLIALLAINGIMFVVELTLGWLAESTGLIADSLDMFADAGVYGISLYVVGKGIQLQSRAANVSGILQIILGFGVLVEVLRRLIFGSEPESILIIVVGAIALIANVTCLMLISHHKDAGVHMRASWIFSVNDVIANLGVIISGTLVWLIGNRYPDLIAGAIISMVVVRGGFKIFGETKQANKIEVSE
jgi:Co/Zn/Cd efflux system component